MTISEYFRNKFDLSEREGETLPSFTPSGKFNSVMINRNGDRLAFEVQGGKLLATVFVKNPRGALDVSYILECESVRDVLDSELRSLIDCCINDIVEFLRGFGVPLN
jgi:hypothetical protein